MFYALHSGKIESFGVFDNARIRHVIRSRIMVEVVSFVCPYSPNLMPTEPWFAIEKNWFHQHKDEALLYPVVYINEQIILLAERAASLMGHESFHI